MPGANNATKILSHSTRQGLVSALLCIYNTLCQSYSKVTCLSYNNSKGACTPSMQDRISLALTVGRWQHLIVTYRARPPANFWCKMQFAFMFVTAPLHTDEG